MSLAREPDDAAAAAAALAARAASPVPLSGTTGPRIACTVYSEPSQALARVKLAKTALARLGVIPPRDVRKLVTSLRPVGKASLLVRKRCLVLALEHVRAMATANAVIIVSVPASETGAWGADTIERLKQRADLFPKVLAARCARGAPPPGYSSSSLGVLVDGSGLHSAEPLPLRALDACLLDVVEKLDSDLHERVEPVVNGVLAELRSSQSTGALRRLMEASDRIDAISSRIQAVRSTLVETLADDVDVAGLDLPEAMDDGHDEGDEEGLSFEDDGGSDASEAPVADPSNIVAESMAGGAGYSVVGEKRRSAAAKAADDTLTESTSGGASSHRGADSDNRSAIELSLNELVTSDLSKDGIAGKLVADWSETSHRMGQSEWLLENYVHALDELEARCEDLRHRVRNTQAFIQVHFDSQRNRLMRMNLVMAGGAFAASLAAAISSAFGMNVPVPLAEEPRAFGWICTGIATVSTAVFVGFYVYYSRTKYLPEARTQFRLFSRYYRWRYPEQK